MTPEGRVKEYIKRVLIKYDVYFFMPVQMGLGAAGVDFHCVVKFTNGALAFFIEAKAPGKKPSDRQQQFAKDRLEKQNAVTFVIDEDIAAKQGSGLAKLIGFLEGIKKLNDAHGTFTQ